MPKREHIVTGVMAFGAGLAFGAMLPRAGGWIESILQKLGFDWSELLLLWDPEARGRSAKRAKKKNLKSKNQRRVSRREHKPIRIPTPSAATRRAGRESALRN